MSSGFDAAVAQEPVVYPRLYFLPSMYTYSSITFTYIAYKIAFIIAAARLLPPFLPFEII